MAEKRRKSRSFYEQSPMEFERTLAIVKPNAVSKIKAIESAIDRSGLLILNRRRVFLKPSQARDFYIQAKEDEDAARYNKLYADLVKTNPREYREIPSINVTSCEDPQSNSKVEEYVDFMTSGPIDILVIAGRGAVSKWLKVAGPENPKIARETHPHSLRAQFGGETTLRNAIHASDNVVRAEKEIQFFFPESRFELEKQIGTNGEYLSKTVNPILLKGLIQLCRQRPDNPLVWLADWLLANNPNARE